MPTGTKIKNYPLIKSKNLKEVRRAKSNIKWYARYKKGLTPKSPHRKPKKQKSTTKLLRSSSRVIKSKIKKAELDITQAKKACRKELVLARVAYESLFSTLTAQYKDLVALEKHMKEVTGRR